MFRAICSIQCRSGDVVFPAIHALGKSERWDLNQSDGNLIFTFADKTVTCEAQIIGSFDKAKGTWLWAWDNPGVGTNLSRLIQSRRFSRWSAASNCASKAPCHAAPSESKPIIEDSLVDAAVPVKRARHGIEWAMINLSFITVFGIRAPSFSASVTDGRG
jgi:hypothetical protein